MAKAQVQDVEREMSEKEVYPYEDETGQTHFDGCWTQRGHHNCAVANVYRLAREVEGLRLNVESLQNKVNALKDDNEELTRLNNNQYGTIEGMQAELYRLEYGHYPKTRGE
jgi:FtsZ-binding cell division protein ZapB